MDGLHVGGSIAIRANKDIKTSKAIVVQAIVVTLLFLGVNAGKNSLNDVDRRHIRDLLTHNKANLYEPGALPGEKDKQT